MQQSHSMYKLCLINSLPWFAFVLLPEVRSFYSLSLSVQESWLLKLPFYRIISSQVKRIWQKGRLESLLQFLRLFVDEAPEVTLNTEIPHPAQTTSRVKQVWTNLLTHPMNPFKVAILRFSGRVCMCSNQLVKRNLILNWCMLPQDWDAITWKISLAGLLVLAAAKKTTFGTNARM